MAFNVNMTEYDASKNSAAPIPIGKYHVVINASEETRSQSGKDMIKLEMEVVCGERGDDTHKGRKLWDYIVDGEYAMQKIGQVFHSCGFDPKTITGVAIGAQMFPGLQGEVKVKHDSYNGEPSAKIACWLTPKEETPLKAWGGGAAPAQAQQNLDDDDIPF